MTRRLALVVLLLCLAAGAEAQPTSTPTVTPTATATATATATPMLTAAPQGRWSTTGKNLDVRIQHAEHYAYACTFPTALTTVTGTATDAYDITDPPCTGLLTNLQVNGAVTTEALWLFTPDQLDADEEHACWVHLLGTDADGAIRACDGVVVVREARPER